MSNKLPFTILLTTVVTFSIFVLPLTTASAQSSPTKYTISGYVRDSLSGEELIGATVYIKELTTGATANVYGFYSITLPEGQYTVVAQFISYTLQTQKVTLSQNTKLDFILSPGAIQLGEVEITAEKKDENITNTQMGVEKIEMKEIENIPVIFGEKDVLKTIQLTPGVKSAGEGNSGFYVRGGSADQNLILLDESHCLQRLPLAWVFLRIQYGRP